MYTDWTVSISDSADTGTHKKRHIRRDPGCIVDRHPTRVSSGVPRGIRDPNCWDNIEMFSTAETVQVATVPVFGSQVEGNPAAGGGDAGQWSNRSNGVPTAGTASVYYP
jgi:hypothetical protein